jgi:hypothetical protein
MKKEVNCVLNVLDTNSDRETATSNKFSRGFTQSL